MKRSVVLVVSIMPFQSIENTGYKSICILIMYIPSTTTLYRDCANDPGRRNLTLKIHDYLFINLKSMLCNGVNNWARLVFFTRGRHTCGGIKKKKNMGNEGNNKWTMCTGRWIHSIARHVRRQRRGRREERTVDENCKPVFLTRGEQYRRARRNESPRKHPANTAIITSVVRGMSLGRTRDAQTQQRTRKTRDE